MQGLISELLQAFLPACTKACDKPGATVTITSGPNVRIIFGLYLLLPGSNVKKITPGLYLGMWYTRT